MMNAHQRSGKADCQHRGPPFRWYLREDRLCICTRCTMLDKDSIERNVRDLLNRQHKSLRVCLVHFKVINASTDAEMLLMREQREPYVCCISVYCVRAFCICSGHSFGVVVGDSTPRNTFQQTIRNGDVFSSPCRARVRARCMQL